METKDLFVFSGNMLFPFIDLPYSAYIKELPLIDFNIMQEDLGFLPIIPLIDR